MVRDARPQMGTVYCVEAMQLLYDVRKTTYKDIVLTHMHSSKELQVMNLTSSILEREKQLVHVYATIRDGRHVSFVGCTTVL